MKKILSLLIVAMMLSVSVFGAEYSITGQDFDRVADKITVNYSGYDKEYMTIFVYSVPDDADISTSWESVEKNQIIGLDQAIGSGSFDIKIKPEFTGNVIIVLGGELGDSTKVLLSIVNGIPEEITAAEYDAGGDSATVGDGKTITIQKDSVLLNATVSTTGTGKVEYTNDADATVTLTGDIYFDASGEIDAVSGKTVEIRSENSASSTYNIGYINRSKVTSENTQYIVTLTDSNGKSASQTFELNSLEGEVRVRVGAENVPNDVTITQSITIE